MPLDSTRLKGCCYVCVCSEVHLMSWKARTAKRFPRFSLLLVPDTYHKLGGKEKHYGKVVNQLLLSLVGFIAFRSRLKGTNARSILANCIEKYWEPQTRHALIMELGCFSNGFVNYFNFFVRNLFSKLRVPSVFFGILFSKPSGYLEEQHSSGNSFTNSYWNWLGNSFGFFGNWFGDLCKHILIIF